MFEVWKTNAGKESKGGKWFPTIHKDIVTWPGQKGDDKRYRFGVREVVEKDEHSSDIKISFQEEVWEGINVRKTYLMIKYSLIDECLFKVEGI